MKKENEHPEYGADRLIGNFGEKLQLLAVL
jgi:hypothetical protein